MTSRSSLAALSMLLPALVSFGGSPVPPNRAAAPRTETPAPARAALPARCDACEAPPADLTVALQPVAKGAHRVTLRRPGHIVALIHPSGRTANRDQVALLVDGAAEPTSRTDVLWETTGADGLATTRGLVHLSVVGGEPSASLSSLPPPALAGEFVGAAHFCRAHADAASGFVVVCILAGGAQRVTAANVTGPRPLEHVAVQPGPRPLIRLNLPLSQGDAEARVIGFLRGNEGVALRAEASWAAGEPEPSLLVQHASRAQPVPPDFAARAANIGRNIAALQMSVLR